MVERQLTPPAIVGSGTRRGGRTTPVTVAICSRERPDELAAAVRAPLNAIPSTEVRLLVIDQSKVTHAELASLNEQGRLRYLHDPGRGVSRARNRALAEADTPYVFFTDDDCELQPGAVEALEEALGRSPDATLAYGSVVASDYVTAEGFVPTAVLGRRRLLRGRLAKRHDHGIGACRAVRRDRALALGGFDERFGPGSAFGAAEDGEFAYRVLRSGASIALEPSARVVHWGRVPWSNGRSHGKRVARSLGALYGVHARGGDLLAPLMLAAAGARIGRDTMRAVLRGRRPLGAGQLLHLLIGFGVGLRAGQPLPDGERAR